jgi:hypothetical protein
MSRYQKITAAREQAELEYRTYKKNPLIICSPGKFEGEPIWAPYFYNVMLNGESEHINGVDYFKLEAEDKAIFPELANSFGVALEESEQGFVHVEDMTEENYKHDKLMQSQFGESID